MPSGPLYNKNEKKNTNHSEKVLFKKRKRQVQNQTKLNVLIAVGFPICGGDGACVMAQAFTEEVDAEKSGCMDVKLVPCVTWYIEWPSAKSSLNT